ncbi:putative internal virion-like protein (endogenous virus) [Gutovirus Vc1]|uniref:Putative internal virion-like protein n=1 Tax=Vibrio phage Vc1 TaxID=1480731 RepID=X2KT22_9CAUD|nr:putative internal virion-like protein [Vibrio phage Vc1]AHN84663.1 putative internal virion-like protein [Vibrio phage Vc1]
MAELERRSLLDRTPTHVPLSILNEEYQPPTPDVEEPSIGDVWDAATYRHWVGESLGRNYAAQETGTDPEYSVSMQQLTEYNDKGYTEQELEFLSGSTSNENLAHRETQIANDRQAVQTIQQAGVSGMAVETVAAVFDPSMIPMMFVGAPTALGTKSTTLGKIGWSMLRGAGEGVLSEYMLKQGDTQRTSQDLLYSAVGGMAFSGAIDLSVLGAGAARNALKRADTVEGTQRAAFNDFDRGTGYQKADDVLKNYQQDPVARKRTLTEKEVIDTLRAEAGERIDVLSPKKVKKLKDEFRAYKKSKLELIEKIKARPKLKPTARKAEIKQLEDAIARRQNELDDKINLNKAGVQSNASIDALQQGKVPDAMMARYKQLKAESGEFDVTGNKMDKITAGHKIAPTEEEPDPVLMQSVGAMRTRTEFDDIQTWDSLLSESDVDEITSALSASEELGSTLPRNNKIGEVPQGLRSLYTELDGAPDQATRGLNAMLLKNPQRTTKGLQSAEELADTLFHRAVPDYLDYTNAFDAYAKDRGVGRFDIGKRNELEQEFDRETVMMQVSGNLLSNKPVDGDSAVMLGAKARSRLYEQGLKNNQDYNVVGFDKIKHRHEYHSVVFDQDNLRRMTGEHADFIYDAIASAYQTGAIRLTRENAIRLAETQVARTMAVKGKANKSFDRFMSDAEFKKIEEELSAQGVERDIINDIKESLFDAEKMGEISPRAMFSLRPNLKARSGDVWLVDLLDTGIARNMKYVSDSAANAGLASNGFHSRHQFQRAVASARDAAINSLRNDVDLYKGEKAGKQAEKALADVVEGRYANKLDEALRLLYREPLEDGDGLKDVTRLLRKATSVTRLRTTGLATLPEGATASVRNGIINTLRQIPATRWFDFRESSVTKDKFMMDFSRTFSATGHQEYLFGRKFYNGSDFDDATKDSLKRVDKNLGHALDVTMTVNGFKTFQHGGEEMVARSIVNNLRDMSMKGEVTSNIRSSLIDVGGMSEEQVERMVKHFKDNDMDVFDSVRLMDADLHNSLSTAVRNTIGHSYLRMSIGEQPAYMNKEMGKIMTTLMSFTIGSYEKMLMRGIKNERAVLLSITAGQAVLGYGALVANTYIQAQGMEDSKRRKYINEKLSSEGMFWGTMARVGVFATPIIPLQILNTVGALPEEMKGAGRMGGVQSSALVADALQATSAAGQLAFKNQNKREQEADWNAIKRVLPWYNSTMYNLTIGTATKD